MSEIGLWFPHAKGTKMYISWLICSKSQIREDWIRAQTFMSTKFILLTTVCHCPGHFWDWLDLSKCCMALDDVVRHRVLIESLWLQLVQRFQCPQRSLCICPLTGSRCTPRLLLAWATHSVLGHLRTFLSAVLGWGVSRYKDLTLSKYDSWHPDQTRFQDPLKENPNLQNCHQVKPVSNYSWIIAEFLRLFKPLSNSQG